ncbi:YlbF family regulator [Diplocloster modestus]|uniref:YlbF family regulator n=1 Tax=Diplocloster modestus TaxID=2850322 RepID=A0ABS6KEU1_9FIRM|nr:YlbF family regulator [Diplocloster modestus]MBU9729047.1 YlbF family regulator [Diplocloster modestus]
MLVADCLRELKNAIVNSEEYQRFERAKQSLDEFPELKHQVEEWRRRYYIIQNQDGIDLFDEVDSLQEEYARIRKNPLMREFLASELLVCHMIQEVYREILDSVDLDLQFLDETAL